MLRNGSITLPKILFYFSRYLSLLIITIPIFDMSPSVPPSRRYCQISITSVNVLSVVSQSFISATMGLKACAIWENRKSISWLIWTVFVAVNTISFTTTGYVTMNLYNTVQYSSIGHFCLATDTPSFSWFIPAAQLFFDTVVTGALCLKAYQKQDIFYSPGSPLLRIIVKNGLMYFLLIDSSAVALTVVWAYVREADIAYAPLYLHLALTASMNSRSLFSLRESLNETVRTSQAIDGASLLPTSKWGTVTATLRGMRVSRNPSRLGGSVTGRGSPSKRSSGSSSDRSSDDSASSDPQSMVTDLVKNKYRLSERDQNLPILDYHGDADENDPQSIPLVPLTEVLLTPPRKRKALTVDSSESFGAFGDFMVANDGDGDNENRGGNHRHTFRFLLNGVEMSLKDYQDVVEARV